MTRKLLVTLLCLSLMSSGCKVNTAHDPGVEVDASSIGTGMTKSLEAAFEAADASAVADLFTEDAVLFSSQQPDLYGRDAIRNSYAEQFAAYTIRVGVVVTETKILGDHGYTRGTFTAKLTPKNGGAAIEEDGRYLAVIQRQPDGSWKTLREMSNSDHP